MKFNKKYTSAYKLAEILKAKTTANETFGPIM